MNYFVVFFLYYFESCLRAKDNDNNISCAFEKAWNHVSLFNFKHVDQRRIEIFRRTPSELLFFRNTSFLPASHWTM